MKHLNLLMLAFWATTFALCAQSDSTQNALILLKKSRALKIGKDLASPDKDDFYLFRNCIYDYELADGRSFSGRLINFRADTFWLTNAFNAAVAAAQDLHFDTLVLPYRQVKKLKFIADRTMGYHHHIRLDRYVLLVRPDSVPGYLPSEWVRMRPGDSVMTEVVAYHSEQGIEALYEEDGEVSYFTGTPDTMTYEAPPRDTTPRVRNGLWVTPIYSGPTTINGLGIGFYARPSTDEEWARINGLNLEIFPVSAFMLLHGPRAVDLPEMDKVEFYEQKIKGKSNLHIRGVSLSPSGIYAEATLWGVQIGGALSIFDELRGVSLSGAFNSIYEFRGVCVAGLRNRSTVGRGVQIALFNRCKDFKGVQIGLWNRNGRRALPLVNWDF